MEKNTAMFFLYRNAPPAFLALLLILSLLLAGCSLENQTDDFTLIDPDVSSEDIIESTSKEEALSIAQKYYKLAYPNIEPDMALDFRQLVDWEPAFDGKNTDLKFALENSSPVAVMITHTSAKNCYLALACAVFDKYPYGANAANNLASAIATYYDDLAIVNGENPSQKDEFYTDAIAMYSYAHGVGQEAEDKDQQVISLTNLGYIFMDQERFEEAFAAFKSALAINNKFVVARRGLYSNYMARKKFQEALDMIAEDAEFYPAIARSVKDVGDRRKETEGDDLPENPSDEALEAKIEKIRTVPVMTTADLFKEIDPVAADRMSKHIEDVQKKMTVTVPNLDYLMVHTSFDHMKTPHAQAALQTAETLVMESASKMDLTDYETMIKKQLELAEQFGVSVNLHGLDIGDVLRNPGKYENQDPQVDVDFTGDPASIAKKWISDIMKSTDQTQRSAGNDAADSNDPLAIYKELSKVRPAYSVMEMNPFDYANYTDLLIQRHNLHMYYSKYDIHAAYLTSKVAKSGSGLDDADAYLQDEYVPLLSQCIEAEEKLSEWYSEELEDILSRETKSIADDNKQRHDVEQLEKEYDVKKHDLHVKYYPRLNNALEPLFEQATSMACFNYTKISKHAPLMYNDCMKHLMLISDDDVRQDLEEELKQFLTNTINTGVRNVAGAYSVFNYHNIETCGCDEEKIEAYRKELAEEANRIANAELAKRRADKKLFDSGVLDENTEYYKRYIKAYETDIDFIWFKGKISPYKSNYCFDFSLLNVGAKFSNVENHIKNTSTYNGGLTLKAGELKGIGVELQAAIGFSCVRGADGRFYPQDVDLTASLSGTFKGGYLEGTLGYEASAIRGGKVYYGGEVTGDPLLDVLKEKANLGDEIDGAKLLGLPTGKEIWDFEYEIKEDK